MNEYRRIIVNGDYYYGKHLIASCKQCNDLVKDKQNIANFLHTLAVEIDMEPFGNPIVERFGKGIEIGISGVQLIETSAITIHTNDNARDLYLDVFSCKDYDESQVLQIIQNRYAPSKLFHQVLFRI